jgi:hypothetical protein
VYCLLAVVLQAFLQPTVLSVIEANCRQVMRSNSIDAQDGASSRQTADSRQLTADSRE